jgi:hypothetical protein
MEMKAMLPYYVMNSLEIIFGIIFFIAAYKFLTVKTDKKLYRYFGIAYLAISILSFVTLGWIVEVSGMDV